MVFLALVGVCLGASKSKPQDLDYDLPKEDLPVADQPSDSLPKEGSAEAVAQSVEDYSADTLDQPVEDYTAHDADFDYGDHPADESQGVLSFSPL